MIHTRFNSPILLALCGLGMSMLPARAELIAYDQFASYTDGNLVGQGKGFGWAGNYYFSAANVSSSGNLSYGSLPTAGGGGSAGTGATTDNIFVRRNLATAITTTGTYYFSFLLQQTGAADAQHNYLRIGNDAANRWAGAGSWNASSDWQLIRNNNGSFGTVATGVNETVNVTHFVIKIDFSTSANEVASLYVNPADAAALTGTANATYTYSSQWEDISEIQISVVGRNGDVGTMAFDEIRVGTEAADMFSVIAEPGTQPAITSISVSGNTATLTMTGEPGTDYFCAGSGDLTGWTFEVVPTDTPSPGSPFQTDPSGDLTFSVDISGLGPDYFFRVQNTDPSP